MGAKNVCIPMAEIHLGQRDNGPGDTALLIIGEKPGIVEDRNDSVFTGPAGKIARNAYTKYILDLVKKPLDVYGTNAVRCCPPKDVDPTETQAAKSSGEYLARDLQWLVEKYDRVVVLACGGPASKALFGVTLSKSLRKQGRALEYGGITEGLY